MVVRLESLANFCIVEKLIESCKEMQRRCEELVWHGDNVPSDRHISDILIPHCSTRYSALHAITRPVTFVSVALHGVTSASIRFSACIRFLAYRADTVL